MWDRRPSFSTIWGRELRRAVFHRDAFTCRQCGDGPRQKPENYTGLDWVRWGYRATRNTLRLACLSGSDWRPGSVEARCIRCLRKGPKKVVLKRPVNHV
jgi:hypothetical protein